MSKPPESRKPPATGAASGPQPGGARESGKSAEAGTGRVVHDARGNAVWDWLKETGRIAIESTSALLKRLEAPELEVEDKKSEELRIESDPEPGGGYDPYNQGKKLPRAGKTLAPPKGRR